MLWLKLFLEEPWMKTLFFSACLFFSLPLVAQTDQHRRYGHNVEEMVVTGAQVKSRSDTALPVNVLSGEELKENAGATLGETLQGQIGVTSASFGSAVGQPVIRGQTSNRVRVLQDGIGTLDASLSSQDHASAVEAILAERIEVIRGPATLLYGNGAIGGVVNVIDNRIPETIPEQFNGAFELRHNTVSDGDAGVFKLDGGGESFAWHLDGVFRESKNIEILGFAVDEQAVEALEMHDEDEEEHEEEEIENTQGFVDNSDTDSNTVTGGVSWVGERGFFGVSVSRLQNEYGLPPGGHGHAHEEEGGAEREGEEEESIRIDMKQTRMDLKGAAQLNGFFNEFHGRLAINDYEHAELEGAEIGTVFSNDGWEGRFTLKHGDQAHSGVVGLQLGDRGFSALGEEAFIPQADIQSSGLFWVETFDQHRWVYEFGLRVDSQNIKSNGGMCDSSESTWSGSAAAIWRQREDANWLLSFSRSERAASVEELFSNAQSNSCQEPLDPEELVVHAATTRIEIGNPNLKMETAQNIEIGFHKHAGDIRAEVNIFHNQIADFIYLADVDEFEETIVSRYLQEDASFTGVEVELTMPFDMGNGNHMDVTLFADKVSAELNSGANVPRIPAMRFGAELAFSQESWIVKLKATSVDDQTDTGINETATDGYTRIDLYFDYHLDIGGNELLFFAKGNNLSDEAIRNHTSFLKNFAPEPGRGYELGLRYTF